MTDIKQLENLLAARSLTFGEFVLSSGQKSNYYVDARKTTMSAAGFDMIGALGLELIRGQGWKPEVVGGLTLGADPVAYAIAHASLRQPPIIDAFSVRKTAKLHGTKRLVEGNFQPGMKVVVVEDVLTSGGSAIQAVEAVRAEGGAVLGAVAVLDREQGGVAALKRVGVDVVCITTISRLGISAS